MQNRTGLGRIAALLTLIIVMTACGSSTTTSSGGATTTGAATTTAGSATMATTPMSDASTAATMAATMASDTSTAAAMTTMTASDTSTAAGTMSGTSMATTATSDATMSGTTMATTATSNATMSGTTMATTVGPTGSGATIKVGSKNFTEEFILGEMYAQLLEANGFKVERKFNLGSEQIAQQALVNKDIDLYPEYTSTGLLTILKLPAITDPQKILDTVKSEYEKRYQLTWLKPAPFNDTNALAMTKKRADELGIKTYTDLSKKADQLIAGGPPEFFAREDGVPGLVKAYGGFNFKATKQLDPGLRYPALTSGQIDVVRAFSTDGQLASPDLVVIQDDKTFYPIYQAAPVVRMDTLQANPQIADILNKLAAPALDDKTMAGLNLMVDGPDKKDPAAVAKDWLTQQGLLK
ncbi:MAG: quaternary ammonium transporter [Herpetosiphonaceae bacterium]|nr:quaternary ammonium transporter [Herpetosiphonaceae bacterium]